MKDKISIIRALNSPIRLKMMEKMKGKSYVSVDEMIEESWEKDMSYSSYFGHLMKLVGVGIVEEVKIAGRKRSYRLAPPERLNSIFDEIKSIF